MKIVVCDNINVEIFKYVGNKSSSAPVIWFQCTRSEKNLLLYLGMRVLSIEGPELIWDEYVNVEVISSNDVNLELTQDVCWNAI